ncbi:hypothetical protein [Roseofilum capinflatum]|uniref:Uncharacterized protein n=1 Tax=Roseofilum capinflatum BLCC-M114 TaxID=3022440 RepID=A0ABT7B316_9CYAN|nr:hypothetical protein [Roseofilum capinflatum]MDJ1173565.1 hypothetical protein [Roseofilum capinflatum BLCC-M114]
MAFTNPSQISKERVAKFQYLLQQQPSMFTNCNQETWAELDEKLDPLADEDYEDIEEVIIDWLDDHDYESVKTALQNVRCDPLKPNETPPRRSEPDQPITNDSLRSAIKDRQNRDNPPSQSSN